MADAAHAELLEHEAYQKPFKVQPKFEFWKTPRNYHDRNLGEDRLPAKMNVWRVQTTARNSGSVVARAYGFTDSPDAEVLVKGFNHGKEYGAVGVGRHGNFLQWGYSAAPSKMTETGRKFFVNCVCYIHRFDGKAPLVRRTSSHRLNALRLAAIINRVSGDRKEFFTSIFPPELWEKYGSDPDGLIQYYRKDIELVFRDKVFLIDSELKSLGLSSNRTKETLERLISLLEDKDKADTAKLLLERYANESFQSTEQWRSWFGDNKDRIFFSDVGGYKFFVVPEGYIETKKLPAAVEKKTTVKR